MVDLCKKFGLNVDTAINQLLDYRNNPTRQVCGYKRRKRCGLRFHIVNKPYFSGACVDVHVLLRALSFNFSFFESCFYCNISCLMVHTC